MSLCACRQSVLLSQTAASRASFSAMRQTNKHADGTYILVDSVRPIGLNRCIAVELLRRLVVDSNTIVPMVASLCSEDIHRCTLELYRCLRVYVYTLASNITSVTEATRLTVEPFVMLEWNDEPSYREVNGSEDKLNESSHCPSYLMSGE